MSSSLHGQMDVEITHPQSSEPTGTGLRKSTLNLNPSSSPSGSSSPQSPTPLLGISLNGDTEALNEQGHEKSFLTRLRQTASLQKHEPSITFNTKVPPDIRAVTDYPPGYGRLAHFETLDASFLICRKFSWLHSRILLHTQDELQQLERALEREDQKDFRKGKFMSLSARREDRNEERQKLLNKIREKLEEYDQLILRVREVQALKRPSERNQGSIYQEMASGASRIERTETHWIRRSDDLAALAKDADHGWFNVWIENVLNWLSRGTLLKLFRKKEQVVQTGSYKYLNLVSQTRFDAVLKGFLIFIATCLLLVPVFILYEIQPMEPAQRSRSHYQVMVVAFFTLAFSICCASFTNAKKQELFTATAAYSAVLVVFLGNSAQPLTGSSGG